MRRCLREVAYPRGRLPCHFALAYDSWAPVGETGEHAGKLPPEQGDQKDFRSKWLAALEGLLINRDYEHFYERWEKSLKDSGARFAEIVLTSRLLVGHGNASATEVGLTVHHTWGVPTIPGSALKGLCAHYTAATYGLGEQAPIWRAVASQTRTATMACSQTQVTALKLEARIRQLKPRNRAGPGWSSGVVAPPIECCEADRIDRAYLPRLPVRFLGDCPLARGATTIGRCRSADSRTESLRAQSLPGRQERIKLMSDHIAKVDDRQFDEGLLPHLQQATG